MSASAAIASIEREQIKQNIPTFRPGDTVRVHAKIIEGTKERVQIFEGVVIKRHARNKLNATFTVRKVSYNIGVERTFMLHSPRIEKIDVLANGKVRRSKLFYLRDLRGKSARIKKKGIDAALLTTAQESAPAAAAAAATEAPTAE